MLRGDKWALLGGTLWSWARLGILSGMEMRGSCALFHCGAVVCGFRWICFSRCFMRVWAGEGVEMDGVGSEFGGDGVGWSVGSL